MATPLNPGDIAIVGFRSGAPDGIAFVPFEDLAAGTMLGFTDASYQQPNTPASWRGSENFAVWTASTAIPAGTVVVLSFPNSPTTPTSDNGTLNGALNGLSGSGDQIFVYQRSDGTVSTTSPFATTGTATTWNAANGGSLLFGINIASTGGFITSGTANLNSTNTSYIPDAGSGAGALTLGTTALNITGTGIIANAQYSGPRNGATIAALQAQILNQSNWAAVDPTSGTLDSTDFAIAANLPSVNLSVSSNAGTEAGQTVITVTATASSAVTGDQTVALGVTGTNITAGDYTLSNSTITIPSGQTTGSVTFTVVDDALNEGTETAVLAISAPSTGLALGSTATQNITITDNDAPAGPTVSITATDANAAESGTTVNPGSFTLTRTGDTTAALTVTYTVGGTATNGSDYNNLTGTVTIPAGQTAATLTVTPVNDGNATEGNETIRLTLVDGATYDLGPAINATVTIADNTTGTLKKVGGATGTGAEIPAFDPGSDRLFVVAGSTVEIYSVSATGTLTAAGSLAPGFTPPAGTAAIPNSVAVKNGIVAVAYAIQNTTTNAQEPGRVSFFNAADGTFLNAVTVGYLPDMLTFTPDGTKVLTANEGEPNSYGQATSFDPEGSVSIINLAAGVANATVQTAGFTSFNSQINDLKAAGVRISGLNATVAQDVEPEYIAVAPDGLTARITLQENNAVAILDIASATITSIQPLGLKDHSQPGNGFDASDRDVNGTSAGGGRLNIQNWPVFGMYQPDAIASYTVNGQTYYITANEGDGRDYTGFSDETRVNSASYILDPTRFPNAATLKNDANLGRLTVSRVTGDTDGDGDIDQIQAYGARSFTIWDANGNRVFDSGDQLEQITATQVPSFFNSDGNFATPNFDTRSDNKGPEPEGVVIGVVNNRTYAFIGLERTGDVIVYEVTDPTKPQFVEYLNTPEDVGVEGLTFISAADSPTGKPLLVTANEISRTVATFEFTPPVRISDIQGTGHISALNGQGVRNVQGIVTAIASNGFYLQDPTPDANLATSEGIFVFTTNAAILGARTVGEAVLVSGTVSEFRPGNNVNNLTITQIGNNSGVQPLSVTAWTTAPTTTIAPVVLGNGGRTLPTATINNDFTSSGNVETGGDFDPVTEGIDFYESLEGMVVQINNAVATSPTANFGSSEEIWVLADNGANATSLTNRGGSLITSTDFNPERIQIDDLNNALVLPEVNVGAKLGPITGVVSYDFNNYEVLVSTAPTVVQPSSLQKEVTTLTGSATQLTVATFNVENLDPSDGATKFNALASAIVANLKSPDIINLEEIQDNNGATNDGTVDANVTLQTLIAAIAAAGGPTYEYRQINPVNNQDGGEPGGNIRVGFLFNPNRVSFVEGSLQRLTDSNLADGDAFASSRKPLVGKFVFNQQEVTVIGNHFNSKGGDQPLFGPNQPPVLSSEVQRNQQATIVKDFVQGVLSTNANANVVVAGDLNDFEFSSPVTILENGGLNTLVETLPQNERYTYNFQGNAQVLDHILVSNNLFSKLDGFDVVHINSEFADQVSDHDPVVARFNLSVPNLAPTAVNLVNPLSTLAENTSTATRIKVADITVTDDALGTNVLSLSGADAGVFEIDSNALYLKASTSLNFEAKSSYAVTVAVDDVTVGSTPDASSVFTLNLTNVNETPIASNDSGFTANQSLAKSISIAALLANDSDPDANTTLTILPTGFTNVVGGSVALSGNTVLFTPNANFSGVASFNYTVSDGSLTSQAIVSLEVGRTVNAGNGNNTLNGNGGDDVFNGGNGADNLFGNGGTDTLFGGNGNDALWGGNGDDLLRGGNGRDALYGDSGKDTLFGDNGDDVLWGGDGDDLLNGGNGRDTLRGGAGRDIFVLACGQGQDLIQDFVLGQDQIGLSGGLSFGQLTFTNVNGSAAIRCGNETLGLLVGVNANQLVASSFIPV